MKLFYTLFLTSFSRKTVDSPPLNKGDHCEDELAYYGKSVQVLISFREAAVFWLLRGMLVSYPRCCSDPVVGSISSLSFSFSWIIIRRRIYLYWHYISSPPPFLHHLLFPSLFPYLSHLSPRPPSPSHPIPSNQYYPLSYPTLPLFPILQ